MQWDNQKGCSGIIKGNTAGTIKRYAVGMIKIDTAGLIKRDPAGIKDNLSENNQVITGRVLSMSGESFL